MKVSIVIPALNEGKYIEATLFHARALKPYEIIVADSHSDDNTVDIAKKYGARVVYARRGAASFGRNAGAKAAKGDILLFLDADSIVFPNLLETVEKDFRDKRVVGWTCLIHAFTPDWKQKVIYNASNDICEFLTVVLKAPHAPGIVIGVRKDVFERIGGFDETLKVMEDHDFALRVGRVGKFKFAKDTCVHTSTRRMDAYGIPGLIKKFSKIYLHYMINKSSLQENMHRVDYEVIR